MSTTVLRDLGTKRKDMDSGPCCSPCPCDPADAAKRAEWENEVVHPCIDAYGQTAKILPIADMEPGVEYLATVRLRLKRVELDEKKGATSGSIAIMAISDLEADPATVTSESAEPGEAEPIQRAVSKVMARRGTAVSKGGGGAPSVKSASFGGGGGGAPSVGT